MKYKPRFRYAVEKPHKQRVRKLKLGKWRAKPLFVAIVACLMLVPTLLAVASFPDFSEVYDPSEWSLVTDGSGELTFPEEGSWDWMGGDMVAPAFPNARIMVENTTGVLFVVYARAMAVGDDTRTGIELSISEDVGLTWTTESIIDGSAAFSYGLPTMDIDSDDNLHVAWIAYDHLTAHGWINYANNSGGDWTNVLANKEMDWNYTYPALQVNGSDAAYVVWQGINRDYHNAALFGWHTHRDANDTVYMLGTPEPSEEGVHDSYKYPSVAIAANDTVWVSYHQENASHGAHRVGVAHYEESLTYITKTVAASFNQSRNACIALNETGSVVIAYKEYNTTASSLRLSIQNTSTDYSEWSHIIMETFAYEGTWLYPSVAVSTEDEMVVTSLVTSELDYGWFWGNASFDFGLLDSELILPPHEYILYSFTHLKWSSHNRVGQDFADQTLWILELEYGEDEAYLGTDIVVMGFMINGEYTHPTDPTPPPAAVGGTDFSSLISVMLAFLPIIVLIGVVIFVMAFMGVEFGRGKGGKRV